MDSRHLEESAMIFNSSAERYVNYLLLLHGNIRKVFIPDINVVDAGAVEIIKREIGIISPDLDFIVNKNDDKLLCVFNKTKIDPADIVFLQNMSEGLDERIEKNEDIRLGRLLGYMCPMVPPGTPLRINIIYTAIINEYKSIKNVSARLFNFVCVLTQQSYQHCNDLLVDVRNSLLSSGINVDVYAEGLKRKVLLSQITKAKLPNEEPTVNPLPPSGSAAETTVNPPPPPSGSAPISIDRELNYALILNGTIRKAYLLGTGFNKFKQSFIEVYNEKIRAEIAVISPDLDLVINRYNNGFIFVVNKRNITPEEIEFLLNIPEFNFAKISKSNDEMLGRLLGYQCIMPITGRKSTISYEAKTRNQPVIPLFSFSCYLTKSKFALCNNLLKDVIEALHDYSIYKIDMNIYLGYSKTPLVIDINTLPDDNGGENYKRRKTNKRTNKRRKSQKRRKLY
jgi:hypothetical protein